MKFTKALIIGLCIAGCSVNAWAETDPAGQSEEMFNKAKENIINGMVERIGMIEKGIGCIQRASDREALKACKKSQKKAMRSHREMMQERREMLRAQIENS